MPEESQELQQEPQVSELRDASAAEAGAPKVRMEEKQHLSSEDEVSEPEGQQQPARSRSTMSEPDEDSAASRLPRRGPQFAIITGIVAGVLAVVINIAITLLSAPLFQQALHEGKNLSSNTTTPLLAVDCLSFFIPLIICFVAGSFLGRTVVRRQAGFIAGMLTGIINYLGGSFLVRYIPNYPGNMPGSTAGGAGALVGGIIIVIIFLLVWGMIGGLVGLWGAGTTSRRRPYRA